MNRLNKKEKDFIVGLLINARIDACLNEDDLASDDLDQDDIGLILAKLGEKEYKKIYLE